MFTRRFLMRVALCALVYSPALCARADDASDKALEAEARKAIAASLAKYDQAMLNSDVEGMTTIYAPGSSVRSSGSAQGRARVQALMKYMKVRSYKTTIKELSVRSAPSPTASVLVSIHGDMTLMNPKTGKSMRKAEDTTKRQLWIKKGNAWYLTQ